MIKVGDLVKYKIKNEIGLVGEVQTYRHPDAPIKLRCWWHTGGTRAWIDKSKVEKLSMDQVLSDTFSNEYVKPSLLERRLRLKEGGDVSDLIDRKDIRKEIKEITTPSEIEKMKEHIKTRTAIFEYFNQLKELKIDDFTEAKEYLLGEMIVESKEELDTIEKAWRKQNETK